MRREGPRRLQITAFNRARAPIPATPVRRSTSREDSQGRRARRSGGENMLLSPDGSLRYFTVRESARLQTFPDDFVFHGSWSETMRQLGNAVPVELAAVVAREFGRAWALLQCEVSEGRECAR